MPQFKVSDPHYQERVRASFAAQAAMKTVGAKLVKLAPGEVELEFAYDPCLTQQNGYVHAGIVTTVVDSACGYAAYTLMAADADVLTIEYKVNFMSPAKGDTFRAIGRVLKAGRTITVCAGEVVALEDGKAKVVATMLTTLMAITR